MAGTGILRRFSGGLGFLSGAFGAAGWLDDARAWARWAQMNPEWAGVLVGAGTVMVVTWIVLEIGAYFRRKEISALRSEIAELKQQQSAPQPVNVRQEVHVHGSEPKREVKTIGGTLLDAFLSLPPPRPRTEADRVRERMEEAARQLPADDDESTRNS